MARVSEHHIQQARDLLAAAQAGYERAEQERGGTAVITWTGK